jgi:hypothetical protein
MTQEPLQAPAEHVCPGYVRVALVCPDRKDGRSGRDLVKLRLQEGRFCTIDNVWNACEAHRMNCTGMRGVLFGWCGGLDKLTYFLKMGKV